MFEQIYKLHGIPKNIISDHDSLFTSIFWKYLHELVGMKLRMSSTYHPQSDGATERANKRALYTPPPIPGGFPRNPRNSRNKSGINQEY
jgi:transposase InsO family protein